MVKLDAPKKPAPQDWHRADIKAALEKRGYSLARLSRLNGMSRGAAKCALHTQWPKMEQLIASAIGRLEKREIAHLALGDELLHRSVTPQDIWPSRYHEDGSPKGPRRRIKFLKHNTTPIGSNVRRWPKNRHGSLADAHD